MLIGKESRRLLKLTQAKSKMYEYDVPAEEQIIVDSTVNGLLLIAVGAIGEISNEILSMHNENQIKINENQKNDLKFASTFFDSLIASKLEKSCYDDYFYLLGAIAYHFCDLIGSSKVMLSYLNKNIDVKANGIEKAIYQVLSDSIDLSEDSLYEGDYKEYIHTILSEYQSFFLENVFPDFAHNMYLREVVYSRGTNRELLLFDALLALVKKKTLNSAMNLLPKFSDVSSAQWLGNLNQTYTIKELWPSQLKLGEVGFYRGESGVVQMPTSSGKTTSVALAIQATFLSGRSKIAVVVAPFRALCKEISRDLKDYFFSVDSIKIDEIFDIPDTTDFSMFRGDDNNRIIVITPEKLLFLLRHDKSILEQLKMVIFDEAHMFDDSSRGTGYELLISTVKHYLPNDAQKILISAVVPNSEIVNQWINGQHGVVVSDNSIKASEKSIAMADWNGKTGQLYFINPENPDEEFYFVPRVVELREVNKLRGERKKRFFPEVDFKNSKANTADLSIYYSLRLIHNGAIAIFCGQKKTVLNILRRTLEIDERGVDITPYETACINQENEKIAFLINKNFGEESEYTKAAKKGVFAHHAGIPIGVKFSIEYAMAKGMIGCVVCTSTLAQGVNLPIKYLIVSSIFQAGERIKVRDFHNLIGRTGRAGKHTEGSVILSEPFVYNRRKSSERYKWGIYKNLIEVDNSEPCTSTILELFKPIHLQNPETRATWDVPLYKNLGLKYTDEKKYIDTINSVRSYVGKNYTSRVAFLENQLERIENTLSEIESYLLSYLEENDKDRQLLDSITKETLGYFLASDQERELIVNLFNIIYDYLLSLSVESRKLVSKTSMGIKQSMDLLKWTEEELTKLMGISNDEEIIHCVIPKLTQLTKNKVVRSLEDSNKLVEICKLWMAGESYRGIYDYCLKESIQVVSRGNVRNLNIDEVVDICEKVFGYDNLLPLNAISVFLSNEDNLDFEELFRNFAKRMRYGLPDLLSVMVFELGFSDRNLAQLISSTLPNVIRSKTLLRQAVNRNKATIQDSLGEYPAYFTDVLNKI